MRSLPLKKLLVFLLKLGVSATLLGVLLTHVDFRAIVDRLDEHVLLALIPALILFQLKMLVIASRWKIALRALGASLPLGVAWRSVLVGQFVNQVLPSTVGGDTIRGWSAWKNGLELWLSVRSVLLDRIFSFLGLIVVSVATLPVFWTYADAAMRTGLGFIAGAGLAIMLALLTLRLIPARLQTYRGVKAVVSISESTWAVCSNKRVFPSVLGLMLLSPVLDISVFWCFAQALGGAVPWWQLALVVPAAVLISAIPVSIAGWGLREGAVVVGFAALGLSQDIAMGASLLFGVSSVITGLIGAFIWSACDPAGFGAIFRSTRLSLGETSKK